MATTTYKGYGLMATGTETNNWGNRLNDDVFTIIDNNLGGIVNKSLTNANITLTSEESEAAILRLSGTLTGNVTVTTQCQGSFFVENATTGAFTVSVRNAFDATSVVAPQGGRITVISDQSNGCRAAGTGDFPTGTRMMFNQTAAPIGWTKVTDGPYNNAAIRTTSDSVSTGGSLDFTSAFAARSISVQNIPNLNVGVSITDPGHRHTSPNAVNTAPSGGVAAGSGRGWETVNTSLNTTGITAAGSFGNTQRGGAQTAMDFAVKYVDVIVAVKN